MKKFLCLLLTAMLVFGSTALGTALADEPVTIQFWNSFTGADGAILERFAQMSAPYGVKMEIQGNQARVLL